MNGQPPGRWLKQIPKVRKPIEIKSWFGETTEDETESETNDEWTEVERKQKNQERRRRTKRMRKEKEMKCATKAARMFGIGPIKMKDVLENMSREVNFEKPKSWL